MDSQQPLDLCNASAKQMSEFLSDILTKETAQEIVLLRDENPHFGPLDLEVVTGVTSSAWQHLVNQGNFCFSNNHQLSGTQEGARVHSPNSKIEAGHTDPEIGELLKVHPRRGVYGAASSQKKSKDRSTPRSSHDMSGALISRKQYVPVHLNDPIHHSSLRDGVSPASTAGYSYNSSNEDYQLASVEDNRLVRHSELSPRSLPVQDSGSRISRRHAETHRHWDQVGPSGSDADAQYYEIRRGQNIRHRNFDQGQYGPDRENTLAHYMEPERRDGPYRHGDVRRQVPRSWPDMPLGYRPQLGPQQESVYRYRPRDMDQRESRNRRRNYGASSRSGSEDSSTDRECIRRSRHRKDGRYSSQSSSPDTSEERYDRRRHARSKGNSGPQAPKLTTFTGRGDSGWDSFIFQFNRYAERYQWSKRKRAERLVDCLSGKALDYVRELRLEGDFKALIRKLGKRFGTKDAPITVRRELQYLRQEETQSLEEFSQKVLFQVMSGFPGARESTIEQLAVEYFLKGCLDKKAAATAMGRNPTRIHKAVQYVKDAINNYKAIYGKVSHPIRRVSFQNQSGSDEDANYSARVTSVETSPSHKSTRNVPSVGSREVDSKLNEHFDQMSEHFDQRMGHIVKILSEVEITKLRQITSETRGCNLL